MYAGRGPNRRHGYRSRRSLHSRRRMIPIRNTKPETSDIKLSDRVEEVRILASEISSAVANVEKWMNAIYNITKAVRDQKALQDIITAISTIENQDKQEELKEIPSGTTDEEP